MDIQQRRAQLRQKQVDTVQKFKSSAASDAAKQKEKRRAAAEKSAQSKQPTRQSPQTVKTIIKKAKPSAGILGQRDTPKPPKPTKKPVENKKPITKESMSIEHSDGTKFMEIVDVIGPAHISPVIDNKGVWRGSQQNVPQEISEKKTECDCDCGKDPCIKCGESHHDIKEHLSNWRSDTNMRINKVLRG